MLIACSKVGVGLEPNRNTHKNIPFVDAHIFNEYTLVLPRLTNLSRFSRNDSSSLGWTEYLFLPNEIYNISNVLGCIVSKNGFGKKGLKKSQKKKSIKFDINSMFDSWSMLSRLLCVS